MNKMCIIMTKIRNYPAMNKEIFILKTRLEELKEYYVHHPSQYVLYEILNTKKHLDNLTKHTQVLRRTLIKTFFKKYQSL